MDKSSPTMAQQLAQAARDFEQKRTGHASSSATAVLSDDTLVITLHGALSAAEKALAVSPAAATQLQEYHRQLFDSASGALRQEIKRITGVEVGEARIEVETAPGAVMEMFATGTVVQVFLLTRSVSAAAWSGNQSGAHS